MGAHDVEFLSVAPVGGGGGEVKAEAAGSDGRVGGGLLLLLANAKNDTNQNVESHVYLYHGGAFSLVQRLPTTGAHDWEAFEVGGQTLLAVANQGNGANCSSSASVGVYLLQPSSLGTAPLKWIDSLVTGCTTFVRSFQAGHRMFLAVAVEREGDDPSKGFRAQSVVFEIVIRGEV